MDAKSHKPKSSLTEAIKFLLAGGVIALSAPASQASIATQAQADDALATRIKRVREKITDASRAPSILPGSTEQALDEQQTMWWRNWGNWHNGGWHNWGNGWHNWHNWPNWHNWGNF